MKSKPRTYFYDSEVDDRSGFKDEYCAKVIEIMGEGKSLDSFAFHLRQPLDTVLKWARAHPEFREALKIGRAASVAWYEGQLRALARGAPGNLQAIEFGLRNRSVASSGWNHDPRKDRPGPEGDLSLPKETEEPFDFSRLSEEELDTLESLYAKADVSKNPPKRN